jgi:hypothetical protein
MRFIIALVCVALLVGAEAADAGAFASLVEGHQAYQAAALAAHEAAQGTVVHTLLRRHAHARC